MNIPTQTKPENITVAVDAKGNIYWNASRCRIATAAARQVKEAAVKKPQPELHIRADKEARYEAVGRVIYTIQRGGIVKVGLHHRARSTACSGIALSRLGLGDIRPCQ